MLILDNYFEVLVMFFEQCVWKGHGNEMMMEFPQFLGNSKYFYVCLPENLVCTVTRRAMNLATNL